MIDRKVYEIDYIRTLQERYHTDPGLLERAVYAFGLLEALRSVGMPFIFKGGTSLMLLLDHPMRLSTDIDILVEPGTVVDEYIDKAGRVFPFQHMEEDTRAGKNGIIKRHFKFTYVSPIRQNPFYILLDIVYAHPDYAATIQREIRNDLLLTSGENLSVEIPTAECLLGDKLTAFAPHTTGIPLGVGKDLEIAKQLYDVAVLADYLSNYSMFASTYDAAVVAEAGYRGQGWNASDVLMDTVRACISIISRGHSDPEDYTEYLNGIKGLRNHVLSPSYSTDEATWRACTVMHLALCLLSGQPYRQIEEADAYLNAMLPGSQYKRLAYIRKQNTTAYAHLVEATRNLESLHSGT